jgi:hypothetical protein
MARLHERVVLADALLEILFEDESHYTLNYGGVVVYQPGVRQVKGRKEPYRFRSVEQLRYDFERDVESA